MYLSDNSLNSTFWTSTLPKIDFPFFGESLIGYLLRMDYINNFVPGTIIRGAIPKSQCERLSKLTDPEIIESKLDILHISKILNIPKHYIENLLISNIRKRLYRYDNVHTKECFHYGRIKVCPICIQEWKIPVLFLFDGIDICPTHSIHLVSQCTCGERLNLFDRKSPLICPECDTPYTHLNQEDNIPLEMQRQLFFHTTYRNFISGEIPLVKENEKIIKGLKQRICFVDKIKDEAINIIKESTQIDLATNSRTRRTYFKWYKCFKFYELVSMMYDIGMPAFQFLNMDVSEDTAFLSSVVSIGAKSIYNENTFNRVTIEKNILNQINNVSFISLRYTHNATDNIKLMISDLLEGHINLTGRVKVKNTKLTVEFNFRLLRGKSQGYTHSPINRLYI